MPEVIGIINIAQPGNLHDTPVTQVAQRVCKRMGGGPAHVSEWRKPTGPTPQAHKPIAPVGRGPEHRVKAAKSFEGRSDVMWSDCRNVRSNDHGRSWVQSVEQSLHALTEVASTLGNTHRPSRPDRGETSPIRRHSKHSLPSRGAGESPDHSGRCGAVETGRADLANLPCEASLDPPGLRKLHHYDEPAAKGRRSSRRPRLEADTTPA
jgi:hypothetical protein